MPMIDSRNKTLTMLATSAQTEASPTSRARLAAAVRVIMEVLTLTMTVLAETDD
jgi:hypothetical protein